MVMQEEAFDNFNFSDEFVNALFNTGTANEE